MKILDTKRIHKTNCESFFALNLFQKKDCTICTVIERWLGNYLLLHMLSCTTIGDEVLNFCVRDGNRCFHFSIITKLNLSKLDKIESNKT